MSSDAERDTLIAELERDLASGARVGVLPAVSVLALAASLFLLWSIRADVAYFFSSKTPIELGAAGDYHLERAQTNRYVQLHGTPVNRGWYTNETSGEYVMVGVLDTAVIVRRRVFDDEQVTVGQKRSPPRPNPFFVRGRLRARADVGAYEEVFRQYAEWSGSDAKWLLVAEDRPGDGMTHVASAGLLVAFAAFNVWLLLKALQRRRSKS